MFNRFFHADDKEGKFIIKVKTNDGKWMYLRGDTDMTTNKSNARRFGAMAQAHTHIAEYRSWFASSTQDYQLEDV